MARVEFSVKVRSDAYERAGGKCEQCRLPFGGQRPEYDHIIPWDTSRDSSPENCMCICRACHREKTRRDTSTIAKGRRLRNQLRGIHKSGGFATNRSGPYKRRMDGTVEKRR